MTGRSGEQAGSSFRKDDVSPHEPGEPDQEHNEEYCAERCRSDAQNHGLPSAFHQIVDADSIGSASAGRGANRSFGFVTGFEFLKLSRKRIPASGELGC